MVSCVSGNHFVKFAGQMTEAARAVGVDDLKIYTISPGTQTNLQRLGFEVFPQLLLFRGGDQYHRKALYYNLKPNSVFKRLQIPSLT
jgi:hypothetical protein